MKKILNLLLILVIASTASAQSSNDLKTKRPKYNSLAEAKEAYDQASIHPETSGKSETWRYRGDLYYRLFSISEVDYQSLDPNYARESFESYKKAKELDIIGDYNVEMDKNLRDIQLKAVYKGNADFNKKKYDFAYNKFLTSVNIAEHFGVTDSVAIYNCAMALEHSGKTNQAVAWYKKSIDIGFLPSDCCRHIILLLQSEKRDAEAMKQISECRTKFPNDQDIIITELNYYIEAGMFDEAITNLSVALKKNPNNELFHYTLGTILDNQGKKEEAISSYKEAIRLKPDYFDANFNAGAFYYNLGIEINNRAIEETDNETVLNIQKEADILFMKALTYLEKACMLKPDDRNTLISLRTLYARFEYTEKYNKINEQLKS